jgi:MFS family permease
MEDELNLSPTQYSFSLGIFFVGYVLMEVPSNNLLKKVRPSRWISRIMVTWGIISTATAAVTSFSGLVTVRILLGIAEAGFFPGIVYYFSFWYKKEEQALRTAFLLCSGLLAGAIGGCTHSFTLLIPSMCIWNISSTWIFRIIRMALDIPN